MTPSLFSFGRSRRRASDPPAQPEGVAASTPSPPEPSEEPEPPAEPPAPPVSPERRALVENALTAWRDELIDLGGASSLDDISLLDAVVDLTTAHPSGLAQLYAGRPTHLGNLVREREALGQARQSLKDVAGHTDLLARQFGVAPVYLAIGVATWTETVPADEPEPQLSFPFTPRSRGADAAGGSDSDPAGPVSPAAPSPTTPASPANPATPTSPASPSSPAAASPASADVGMSASRRAARAAQYDGASSSRMIVRNVNAPVLLRPVRLSSATAEASLTLDPSIEVNPVLIRALHRYGSTTDVEAIAHAALSAEGFTPRAALARIGGLGREYLPGFEMHERLVVGAFVHPGQALVEDFDATIERARTSALVAALAGDEIAREALDVELPASRAEDRAPEAERGAGDLDPAQLDAVEAVGSGASLLLDAPPGSDVAASLAAVAADAAASGRTVLHVPATSADGHAVADALRDLGLGDIVLDLTEDAAWRRHAGEGIKEALGVVPPELDVAAIVDMRERLMSVRTRLTRYVGALHQRREPWGVSAYDALQKLADLTTGRVRARTKERVAPGRLERLDDSGRARAVALLTRAHMLGVFSPRTRASAWNGISITDIDEATDVLAQLARLADDLLPTVQRHIEEAAEGTGLTPASTLADWCEQLDMLDGVRDSLDIFIPEVFERSAADLVIATASRRWREERDIEMSSSTRRRFIRQAKDLVRPGRDVSDLHAELVKVQQRREIWRRHDPDGGWPTLPPGLDEMKAVAARARRAVAEVQPVLGRAQDSPELMSMPLGDLETRARDLADDDTTAQILPELGRLTTQLDELGLVPLAEDLADRAIDSGQIEDELTYCWWSSLLAQILRDDSALGGLDVHALNDLADSLRELDAAQADSLAAPVAHACAGRVRAAIEADKEDARELYRALSRDDGVPLRDIIAAHRVAMVAKPVWIVPPTLVPQVLSPEAVVDLAVLDASAHMPVAQVMPAFVRAEQVLVVGDPRRATTGLAAELGPLLPSVTLPTGRNTLDSRIAAFLATNGYEGVVEAVPAPPGTSNLSLELVDGRGMPAPGEMAVESVPTEVNRVVDLVIDHALSHPERSLAVVALNSRHAEEIRRATANAAAGSAALDEFFAAGIAEPFVVVDLSEARSLRRDHAIISVGYAKTPHGRTIHSFGAVSQAGGMVGLVEALCVSRNRAQVVSCLGPDDLDPERLHAPGARLLREVLLRASGSDAVEVEDAATPDRLLVDLAEHLWRKGLEVVPRYGVPGGPHIPLAIGHPDYPGELFVAVLTDDDAYVAEPSLRRRDRHWVERLQHRGWLVHTAFSAGVFVDPEAEARRVEALVLSVLTERSAAEQAPPEPQIPAHLEETASPPPPRSPDDTEEVAPPPPSTGGGDGRDGSDRADGTERGDDRLRMNETSDRMGPEMSAPTVGPRRAQRPPIAEGLPLQAYSDDQLDDMMVWIRSDGVQRDEQTEVEELRAALALTRNGAGISAVLSNAVRRTR